MRVLFLTDEFHPDFGANSLVIKSICEQLVCEGKNPYVMPFNYDEKLTENEEWNGIHIVRKIKQENKTLLVDTLRHGYLRDAIKMTFNAMYVKFINRNDFRAKERIAAREILEEWILEHNIDIVVSICCSVELSLPLLYLREHKRLECRWILYMIDPFESHSFYRKYISEKILCRWQHRLMMACDKVVTTDLIYRDMVKWEVADILNKTVTLGFPKIVQKRILDCTDDINLPPNGINIICTGTKNENERNSSYVINVCKSLKKERVYFHFVGFGWAEKNQKAEGNVIMYPPCSWQAANNLQLRADFLLNIGNKTPNQIPSKILEYISTGKPIINFCKSKDCPTTNLLRDYTALTIFEQSDDIEKAVNSLNRFVSEMHPRMEFEIIERDYMKYTPRYICDLFFR